MNIIICITLIFVTFSIAEPVESSGQVREEWVVNYNGSGNRHDEGRAIAVDLLGNVYVTGESYGGSSGNDFMTIKYDSYGNELWKERYNGPDNYHDYAKAIAVDPFGNLYVTGYSSGVETKFDYTTIKYDSNGNELWVRRYNGPGNSFDNAVAMALGQNGNIYVTGTSVGNGTNSDYATVAYDPSGKELWVARYNGLGNDFDKAHAIAVDTLGNIIVTGGSSDDGIYVDCVTIKYDRDGNELWITKYAGPGKRDDYSRDLTIDSFGNVYITGVSIGNSSGGDFITIKYDSNGNEMWRMRYNGPGNSGDGGNAIAIDSVGNVFVTGDSIGNGTYTDFTTIAYDPSGRQLWIARYDGPNGFYDFTISIVIDPSGNILVAGDSYGNNTKNDYALVAYDLNGSELWVVRYDSQENSYDECWAMAINPLGNIYLTGSSFFTQTSTDYTTIKYSHEEPTHQGFIDIDPDTLNLDSRGKWITTYITLNNRYDVNEIDIGTVMLEDSIPAEWGDVQGEKLMVKFDRWEVEDMLSPGTYNLKVSWELKDGTKFEGYSDEIRVIDPGK